MRVTSHYFYELYVYWGKAKAFPSSNITVSQNIEKYTYFHFWDLQLLYTCHCNFYFNYNPLCIYELYCICLIINSSCLEILLFSDGSDASGKREKPSIVFLFLQQFLIIFDDFSKFHSQCLQSILLYFEEYNQIVFQNYLTKLAYFSTRLPKANFRDQIPEHDNPSLINMLLLCSFVSM